MIYNTKNIFEHPFNESADFNECFNEYLLMRKKMRKPPTERAIRLLLLTAVTLSNSNVEKAIKIIDRSLVNNWLDFYPLKDDNESMVLGKVRKEL